MLRMPGDSAFTLSPARAIEPEPAHRAVGIDQAAADQLGRQDLRQPALAEAAHQLHLPEAVLGMDVAQPEGGVLERARDDVRHGVPVAHDLDRRASAPAPSTWPL